jgi:predicted DCC family thiol-disulfide oxidoreductase YuxK
MTDKLRVFFDGGCPMCSKEIGLYKNLDAAGAIEWLDISREDPANTLPLPRETLLARFHVQTPDGRLLSGARGFIEMWHQLPKWRWLAKVCSMPTVPFLLELGYCGFLKIRPAIQNIFRWR